MSAPKNELPPELSSHDRILLAARRLFATAGYENSTTSAIARQAGTSESQLIKHFGSKEGLLEAIFDHAWQRLGDGLRDAVDRHEAPVDKLRDLIDLMISALEGDREMRTLMLLEGRRIRRHGHLVVLTQGYLQVVRTIDQLLRSMQELGQLKPGFKIDAIRSALVGSFEGLLRDQLLAERMDFPADYGPEDLRATYRAVLECFLARPAGGA